MHSEEGGQGAGLTPTLLIKRKLLRSFGGHIRKQLSLCSSLHGMSLSSDLTASSCRWPRWTWGGQNGLALPSGLSGPSRLRGASGLPRNPCVLALVSCGSAHTFLDLEYFYRPLPHPEASSRVQGGDCGSS